MVNQRKLFKLSFAFKSSRMSVRCGEAKVKYYFFVDSRELKFIEKSGSIINLVQGELINLLGYKSWFDNDRFDLWNPRM